MSHKIVVAHKLSLWRTTTAYFVVMCAQIVERDEGDDQLYLRCANNK